MWLIWNEEFPSFVANVMISSYSILWSVRIDVKWNIPRDENCVPDSWWRSRADRSWGNVHSVAVYTLSWYDEIECTYVTDWSMKYELWIERRSIPNSLIISVLLFWNDFTLISLIAEFALVVTVVVVILVSVWHCNVVQVFLCLRIANIDNNLNFILAFPFIDFINKWWFYLFVQYVLISVILRWQQWRCYVLSTCLLIYSNYSEFS